MEKKKSKVIYLESRKPADTARKLDPLDEAKNGRRTNHVVEACSLNGHYTRIPNCIYEIGLSWQEREVWMYFNRLEPWEHPLVESIHKTLGIGKAAALTAIEKLCGFNMLVVEGERTKRKFHIPHPSYWKHEIPQNQYAFKADEDRLPDIGSMFNGVVVKRSKQNVPNRTSKNVPDGTSERSKQNVKTPPNVPNRTFESQQSQSQQGLEPPFKTYSQDLIRLSLNPGEVGQMNLPGGRDVKVRITVTELEGQMRSLYHQHTCSKVISALIKGMLRKISAEQILRLIEAERAIQTKLVKWNHQHMDIWLYRADILKKSDGEKPNE